MEVIQDAVAETVGSAAYQSYNFITGTIYNVYQWGTSKISRKKDINQSNSDPL